MALVKTKKIVPDMDKEALTDLFEQMTGMRDADIDIIMPKYIEVMTLLKKIYKLYLLLSNLDVFVNTFSEYGWVSELTTFINSIKIECGLDLEKNYNDIDFKQEIDELFYKDIYMELHKSSGGGGAKLDNKKISEVDIKAKEYVNGLYRNVKNSQSIKKIMITSANLAPFKIHLSCDDVSDTFIKREPGNTFIPLAFSGMDLKLIWNSDIEPKGKKFLLSILQHTFRISYQIYDIIYSPDVDIAHFSDLLVTTITKLRTQIPRCDRAFDVIESSVNMLKTNFKDYFRLSVESENPSTILESFVIDVAGSQKANPSVVAQFRRITAFMKKNAANTNDPRVKQLFKMLNTQFSKIDKEMKVDTTTTDAAAAAST